MTKRYKAPFPKQSTPSISPQSLPKLQEISFSFKYLDLQHQKFCIDSVLGDWFKKLFERMRDISRMTANEVKHQNKKGLRHHEIRFSETTEPDGFTNLSGQIKEAQPYQLFQVSTGKGRAHGLFIGDIFYVVWIDANHELYS